MHPSLTIKTAEELPQRSEAWHKAARRHGHRVCHVGCHGEGKRRRRESAGRRKLMNKLDGRALDRRASARGIQERGDGPWPGARGRGDRRL